MGYWAGLDLELDCGIADSFEVGAVEWGCVQR